MILNPAAILASIRKLLAPDHARDGSTFAMTKPAEEWRQALTPDQYHVLREHGTERPGSSRLLKEARLGAYRCAGCGAAVYAADAKFDSGTGWPSFTAPVGDNVETRTDRGLLMSRSELHCANCGGHLGHRSRTDPIQPACVIASAGAP